MSIKKSLKDAMLTGSGLVSWQNNTPTQYAGKQHQYFSPETRTFTHEYAKYAADYVEAQVQGLTPGDPFAWQTRYLRMADIVRPSAAILRRADNYKIVLFADRDIEYIVPGSKIVTMGSTWIVANPFNVSGSDGCAIVERCNAVWNYLDFYGNVLSEPMVVTNYRADANDSDAQEGNLITKGYFNCVCQYNDVTRQIDTNTRFILGTGAYRVTGFSDFSLEFTGDYDSVRLLEFTVRYEEPNLEIDDMAHHVAGGKSFSWEIALSGAETVPVGQTRQMTAASMRNGERVESTEEHPIGYLFASSDESVASVDGNGTVTGISAGTAVVTATLEQNPEVSASMTIEVAEGQSGVAFTSPVPKSLAAYNDVTLTAAWFENGAETGEPLEWTFSGAKAGSYKAVTGDRSATVYGFGYSEKPLIVTAEREGFTSSAEIELDGI